MMNRTVENGSPDLSIIVASSDNHRSLEQTLAAIENQVGGRAMEISVATDNPTDARLVRERFGRVNLIESQKPRLVPELWGLGVTRARGRLIAITIASVIPNDDWVETLLRAQSDDYAALGGAIENAPDASLLDWAVYFVRYTSFMLPFHGGSVNQVAGDNCAYKRAAIAEQMEWIDANGFWEAEVNDKLCAQGKVLWSDPRLIVHYANAFTLLGFARQRFAHGKLFGRLRAAKCTPARRALYVVTSPAIPLVHLARRLRNVMRKKRNRLRFVLSLPLTIFFLFCWATGEFLGLAFG
jgi:hypothetical protein